MRKYIWIFLAALLLLAALAACGTPPPETAEADSAPQGPSGETMTLLVYMIGSDLEASAGAATSDMEEMAASGVDTEHVRLLVYTGGSVVWHSDVPSDANALFLLTEDGFSQIASFEPMSMGSAENLTRFLTYGYENYPADSYALILWDHGNGPVMGYGLDKQYDNDSMTLDELRNALAASPFGGENRLAFLGCDACLMASAELVCVTADYADYLIASQETEPSFGWNYAFLSRCGSEPAEALVVDIVDAYMAACEEFFEAKPLFQSDVTLSAIDLSGAEALEGAIDALFAEVGGDVRGDYIRLASARVNTRALGRASTGSEYDLVDLDAMARQLEELYPKQTAALRQALEDVVVYTAANTGECCGMSLYYPFYNKSYYQSSWKETYRTLGLFPAYLSYLERYEQAWLGTDMKAFFTDLSEPAEGAEPSTYTLALTEEQASVFAGAQYYILRREGAGLYSVVYVSSDVAEEDGLLTATFGGSVIYAETDYGRRSLPIARLTDTIDGVDNYKIFYALLVNDVLSLDGDTLSCEILFSADAETGELRMKGIYSNEDDGELSTGKKEPIELTDWDVIRFYREGFHYLTRDEDGRILPFWDWPTGSGIVYNELPTGDNVHFTYAPLYDDGSEYFLMFDVMDVQGSRYSSELLPIRLAPAPETAYTPPETVIDWPEGDTMTLLEEGGLTLSLTAGRGLRDGALTYILHAVDHNDTAMIVTVTDLCVNDTLCYPNHTNAYFSLDPGEEEYNELVGTARLCALAGVERADVISFRVKAQERETLRTLADTVLTVRFGGEAQPQPVCSAFLGARAERQLLLETDDMRVSLDGLGYYWDRGSAYALTKNEPETLTTLLRFENLSDRDRTIGVLAMECSGVYIRQETSMTLAAGESMEEALTWSDNLLRCLGNVFFGYAEEEGPVRRTLDSISSVRLLLTIDGELFWCPVELAERGAGETLVPEGELLWEDDTFEVLLDNALPLGSAYLRCLWITNRSEDYYFLECVGTEDEEEPVFLSIGPEATAYVLVPDQRADAGAERSVVLRTVRDDTYTSGQFLLPAEEG